MNTSSTWSCNCTGPKNADPLCPCLMRVNGLERAPEPEDEIAQWVAILAAQRSPAEAAELLRAIADDLDRLQPVNQ